ncbi:MAG: hypothetical protein VYC15_03160 [Pseudomonadota bacterium]|nr:hypothetical protein [Pseudomonadota bacterium]
MKKNWFYKKDTIKKFRIFSLAVLGLVVLTESFTVLHPHFVIERIFGFYAIFGFLSCVGLIIFAKCLGFLSKRKEDYYDV